MSAPTKSKPEASAKSKPEAPPVERLTYRMKDVAALLGVGERTIQRERSAGRFPPPTIRIGKSPLWTREDLEAWIKRGGGR